MLRLVLGIDTAQELTRADAAAWRIALQALSEKKSLDAVIPSKPQTKLTLSEVADARARRQSPAAVTGQGGKTWAEDANAAIQPFIQDAVSVTEAFCTVYKERKQEAFDDILETFFLLAEAINNVLPETKSTLKTTEDEEARAQQTASLLSP